MTFNIGDLVRIVSSHNSDVFYGPPAVVIRKYRADPKIFLHNEKENRKWVEEEGIVSEVVYDIMYEGEIEEAVRAEWLRPLRKRDLMK
tara:strand:- start:393 stop:656 length:264 start_codon:yes stop_codon:yes gene_type:complete